MNRDKFSKISPLADDAIVTDIVYNPLITPILKKANARHLKTVDGLGMLLYQAVLGFESWFNHKPVVTMELRNYILDNIAEQKR
jgi:shikimate dehydrogenase